MGAPYIEGFYYQHIKGIQPLMVVKLDVLTSRGFGSIVVLSNGEVEMNNVSPSDTSTGLWQMFASEFPEKLCTFCNGKDYKYGNQPKVQAEVLGRE
jgi:hypothetical protein